MFEDSSTFITIIQSRFSRILSIWWVRWGSVIGVFCIGIGSVLYGIISLISSGKAQESLCTIEAPKEYHLAQAARSDQSGQGEKPSDQLQVSGRDQSKGQAAGSLVIDVSGAVQSPGVYYLKKGSRIAQALEAADGVTSDADTIFVAKELNLSKSMNDGTKIYIPFATELSYCQSIPTTQNSKSNSATGTTTSSTSDNNEVVVGSQDSALQLISINFANKKTLTELTGIGEKRAEAIIESRPYNTISDLVKKEVLTQTLYDEIENDIQL